MPVVLGTLAAGNEPLSIFDQDFDSVARMGVLACTPTGTNTLALAGVANYPTLQAYGNNQKIGFIALANSTGAVTLNVNGIGAVNAYRNDGVTQLNANDIVAGVYYELAYIATLNSGAGGFQLTNTSSVSSNAASSPGGFLNRFRNGTMDVWQRGAGTATVTTAGGYTSDGWIVTPTGASCTIAQTILNARAGSLTFYSLLITGASSVTDITLKQRIESFVAQPLEAQTVTVQAQVFNNTGGTITPTLTVKHATAQDNWASTVTDVNAANLQGCTNGVWTQVCYTFTASSVSGNGLEVTIDFGNNFTTTGKSVQVTELDIRATPGTSVGLNPTPPPPEMRPVAIELDFCQRYFYSIVSSNTSFPIASGYCFASTSAAFLAVFPNTMRVAPTSITVDNVIHFTFQSAASFVASNTALDTATPYNCSVTLTITGGTAGQGGRVIFNSASGTLWFLGAEL